MEPMLPTHRGTGFSERLRRRDPMLGAVLPSRLPDRESLADLDFVVVADARDALVLRSSRTHVLVRAHELADVRAAIEAGAAGVVLDSSVGAADTAAEFAVLVCDPDGHPPWQLVSSVAEAREALHANGGLVVYDLPTMIDRLVEGLPEARTDGGAHPHHRPPVLLLSGMLGDESLWDEVAAGLSDIALPWPSRIDLDDSISEMAASVLAQAPDRFVVAGHSLGAIVALEIERQARDRLLGLVLVNASARGPSPAQQAAWSTWRERTADGQFAEVAAELARTTLPSIRRGDAGLVARSERMARAVGAEGFIRQLAAQSTRPDSLPALGQVDVPVLVVSGELDEVCPPTLQHELAASCRRAGLVTVAGAGHMIPLEDPDALVRHVRTWLAESVARLS